MARYLSLSFLCLCVQAIVPPTPSSSSSSQQQQQQQQQHEGRQEIKNTVTAQRRRGRQSV